MILPRRALLVGSEGLVRASLKVNLGRKVKLCRLRPTSFPYNNIQAMLMQHVPPLRVLHAAYPLAARLEIPFQSTAVFVGHLGDWVKADARGYPVHQNAMLWLLDWLTFRKKSARVYGFIRNLQELEHPFALEATLPGRLKRIVFLDEHVTGYSMRIG